MKIAIDGPSGSGKSSVSRAVASRLGYAYLDTGAMYRAACWLMLDRGVTDDDEVTALIRSAELEPGTDPDHESIAVNGRDVTTAIREDRVTSAVSKVATNLDVRTLLIAEQRRLIAEHAEPGIVAEGRDITTVVAPDAEVRLLLTAREEARLARRARELHGTADADSLAATRESIVGRDAKDSTVATFETASDGVHTLDSSSLTLEETIQAVMDLVADAHED
ncbi:(d)CMP kinase [Spelaeicoccus albus]|uniref:Cytidylate kinase n=1 Tax=Spelaeicoccus albus TaxID=1280376 RepID=A0A7Z0D546_9MICO|nr:(d)CMP kinase [Spelaeicoccus albus]NYI69072.1 cytidylate kinase [Spelaeicoccus albus]